MNMKKLLIISFLLVSVSTWAQDFNERIAIPLSSPGDNGKLDVGLVRGDIKVTAYNGKEVIIEATSKTSGHDHDGDCGSCDDENDRPAIAGMKKISSSPIELSASERNNRVEIETNSWPAYAKGHEWIHHIQYGSWRHHCQLLESEV